MKDKEEETLVDREQEVLNQISECFYVKETKYGGKGCFSYSEIPCGETILISKLPVSFTIAKECKKEICQWCFKYENGNNMKCRLGSKSFLYFCSEECVHQFKQYDSESVLLNSLLALEVHYNSGLKKPELKESSPKTTVENIAKQWKEVDIWNQQILQMKSTKWSKFIPRIDDSQYMEIKYIFGVLYQMYLRSKNPNSSVFEGFLNQFNNQESQEFELQLFEYLQSNEISKVQKYPELLSSYLTIYKFIKLTSPPQFQPFIDPLNIRLIIGRNLTNGFGIWSLDHEKQFFGFGVFPSGSFFNHSCAPNIVKKRVGNQLHFITNTKISAEEELCIDYGNYLEDALEVRKAGLAEWFFDCGCVRCEAEALHSSEAKVKS